jgi:hypothetical protein
MAKAKRPVGRPRTKTADLPKCWQRTLIQCGDEGGSDVKMRLLLGIGEVAWNTLIADSEEFSRTVKEARLRSQIWWEDAGRSMALGAQGNATVWIFNMKNRFAWRDSTQIDHTSSDGSMSPKAAVELTDEQLARIAVGKRE